MLTPLPTTKRSMSKSSHYHKHFTPKLSEMKTPNETEVHYPRPQTSMSDALNSHHRTSPKQHPPKVVLQKKQQKMMKMQATSSPTWKPKCQPFTANTVPIRTNQKHHLSLHQCWYGSWWRKSQKAQTAHRSENEKLEWHCSFIQIHQHTCL